jgi:putative transposase
MMMAAVTEEARGPVFKKAAAQRRADRVDLSGSKAAAELAASGALDGLFDRIDSGEIELTGDGGFIPGLIKATLERGPQVELTSHLGYEKGDAEASAFTTRATGRRRRRSRLRPATSTWPFRVTATAFAAGWGTSRPGDRGR